MVLHPLMFDKVVLLRFGGRLARDKDVLFVGPDAVGAAEHALLHIVLQPWEQREPGGRGKCIV